MMFKDFMKWLRDMQILDTNLTPLAAKHIFAHTQLEEAFMSDADIGGGEDAMVYDEFLEGLCALSLYKVCNPYISMSRRYRCRLTCSVVPPQRHVH